MDRMIGFYNQKMEIFIGSLSSEMQEDIGKFGLSSKWRCVILREEKNRIKYTVKIIPESLLLNYTHLNEFAMSRNPNNMTSLVFRFDNHSLLFRRGPIDISNEDYERRIEHNLANVLKNAYDAEHMLKRDEDRINLISFNDDNRDAGSCLRYFKKKLVFLRKRANFIKSKLRKYSISDTNLHLSCDLFEENIAMRYCLYFSTYLSVVLRFGESVLIEDTKEISVSFILCSLIKLMNSNVYCTIDGFLLLLKSEWMNYGYDFYDGSNTSAPKNYSYDVVPYRLFHICVLYLLYTNPEDFEFNFTFMDLIEIQLLKNEFYFEDNLIQQTAFDKILESRSSLYNDRYNPTCTLFEKYEDTIYIDKEGQFKKSGIYQDDTYKEFWKVYMKRIFPTFEHCGKQHENCC